MSTRRERAKEPVVRQNKQLEEMDIKRIRSENQKNLRYADIFTNLADLVFGGIIIGGVFENMEHPIYLYLIGFSVFFILIWLGNVYYTQNPQNINYVKKRKPFSNKCSQGFAHVRNFTYLSAVK